MKERKTVISVWAHPERGGRNRPLSCLHRRHFQAGTHRRFTGIFEYYDMAHRLSSLLLLLALAETHFDRADSLVLDYQGDAPARRNGPNLRAEGGRPLADGLPAAQRALMARDLTIRETAVSKASM
jgi:hypothetical protein